MNFDDEHSLQNGHCQSNEILALKSIFESNVLTLNEDERNGRFLVNPVLPKTPFEVTYNRLDDSNEDDQCVEEQSFFVQHLPPIELHFELNDKYPSEQPPNYWISCIWLSVEDLTKICSKLDNLWHEFKCEILFIWFEFLRNEVLTFLNYSSTLSVNFLHRKMETSESALNHSINNEPSFYDKRVVPSVSGSDAKKKIANVTNHLKSYNEKKCREDFETSYWTCIVCFRNRIGADCVFLPCFQSHSSCKEGVSEYFKVQIQDGNIHMLKCPDTECKVDATSTIIKELVGESLYQRYDQLLFSFILETMGQVVYCPRKHCQAPVVSEKESKLALCSNCSHSFCKNCKFTYHGISPCRMLYDSVEERNEIVRKYMEADDDCKRAMEFIYGKKQIQDAFEAFLSDEYISDNSKKCPSCGANIEKSEGCNKMTCLRCNNYFCWLCEKEVPRDNPYYHFNDPRSKCFNKLFQEVDGRDFFDELLNEGE